MSEINSKANLEYDFDLDIVKQEIKLEPYLVNMKSEFGDDILDNAEQKHNFNISQNFEPNTNDETAIIETYLIKVETTDTSNPVEEDDHNIQKGFTCDVCEFRTTRGTSLQNHKKIHLIKMPFICNACEYRTSYKCTFERHLCIHSGEKPFACNFCEYKSVSKGQLNRHMTTHTGKKPQTYEDSY